MKAYGKPCMTRHNLMAGKSVAKRCWGWHSENGGSPWWWYDKNGEEKGFVQYHIEPGAKCGEVSSMIECHWYYSVDDLNAGTYHVVTQGQEVTPIGSSTPVKPFDDLVTYLISLGGSNGNNFAGEDEIYKDKYVS